MGALADAGHPTVTMSVDGAADLGRVFFFAEFATAVAGWGLGINPFDQPNVQEAKDNTAKCSRRATCPTWTPGDWPNCSARPRRRTTWPCWASWRRPRRSTPPVAELRAAIRDATQATTTFGYGPRYLHSTGQLHKGGPPTGLFIQLVHDGDEDVEIPGAGYTFRH